MTGDIDFRVSLHPSKFLGHWNVNKAKEVKRIVLFLGKIWREAQRVDYVEETGIFDVDLFIREIIRTIVIETVCIERANQGLRIKNRCKPCKVHPVATSMLRGV